MRAHHFGRRLAPVLAATAHSLLAALEQQEVGIEQTFA
jgi:hypothetical protein